MVSKGLNAWVTKLQQQNMPVLGSVITELNAVTGNNESNVNQLAEVVLRDPNLTAYLLRVANSVQFNYSKTPINTVSRAAVMIGIEGVRSICLSLLLIDSLLSGKKKQRVLELIAQGFHAATQARAMIAKIDEKYAEEAFIAALLFNLGEMAFWAGEDLDTKNTDLMSDDPAVRKAAMEATLGTSFKAITRELARHWKLGETLELALFPGNDPSPRVKAVITGERLSRAALQGWDSPQIRMVLDEVAELTGVSLEQAASMVKSSADEAAEVALTYGVPDACPLIPSSTKKLSSVGELDDNKASKILKADIGLQLNILRELSNATNERIDVNTIFQMVLEGMHRGAGLERVVIAFVEGNKLKAKYMLGEGTEHWRSGFLFDIGPYSDNIFTTMLEQGGAHWINEKMIAKSEDLYPDNVVRLIGKKPAFISVLQINDRKVALFYADRSHFGGKLNADQFESFKHFANQAQINLNLLSKTPNKS